MAVIRKIIVCLLLVLSVFISPKADKLILTAVSATPETVVIECENKTGKKLLMNSAFTVEKQVGEKWEELLFCDDFPGFKEISTEILPTEKIQIKIDAFYYFGKKLENGTYRVNICAYIQNYGEITANAQFSIAS